MTSPVFDALQRVTDLAQADAAGDVGAHAQLLRQLHQLQLAIEKPAERTMRMRFQMLENICIRVALEYGILQNINARQGASVSAAELSQETGADELLIIRTMRTVTYVGVADEVDYGTYAGNETTAHIVQKGFIAGEKHHTDLTMPIGGQIVRLIRKGKLHQFPEGPDQQSPFAHVFGKPFWDYLHNNPEQKEAFDDYMAARRDPEAPQWFEVYPVSQELGSSSSELPPTSDGSGEATMIVDVGGGSGHEISKFRRAFPDLPGRFVLEDLPVTLQGVTSPPEGVEMVPHNFFNEQPVKGARIYFLRNVMHDWPDKECATILAQIVAAMDPTHSRILIDDYVLPDTQTGSRAASMDILMFLFSSGIERSQHQWEALLHGVGLEIVKVWRSETGSESVLEAKVRSSS